MDLSLNAHGVDVEHTMRLRRAADERRHSYVWPTSPRTGAVAHGVEQQHQHQVAAAAPPAPIAQAPGPRAAAPVTNRADLALVARMAVRGEAYERGRLIALRALGKLAVTAPTSAAYDRGRSIALRALGKAHA